MNTDRAVGIAGLILALPGFILLFLGNTWAVGLLAAALLVGLGYVIWIRQLPLFTIKSVEKEIRFLDDRCQLAKLTRRQRAVANHKGITEFWCRNISADGEIRNILIDGKKPDAEKMAAGDREVCKRFDRPLKRGAVFSTELSYELVGSFNTEREGIIHVVEGRTRRVKLTVLFPAGKRIYEQRALLRYGGEERSELEKPSYENNRLEIEIKRPKLGAQYCLEWRW